jgi:hypothetical protein
MDKDACHAAIDAWRAAEKTYSTESARYWSVGWPDSGVPFVAPEKAVTHGALDELSRLRAAAEAAQRRYREVCWDAK